MSLQTIIKTVTFKLYLAEKQEVTLNEWLRLSCRTYNRCLEHRIKAYKRRKESVGFNQQCLLLTGWRERIDRLDAVPAQFLRDSLRRVDRGFQAFFRRLKEGVKNPGFPRFRSQRRYNSLECLAPGNYIGTRTIRVPKLGHVRARGQFGVIGEQRLLRVLRKPSGWYAQVLIDTGEVIPEKVEPRSAVGIDVGLSAFLTTSDGDKVENPRYLRMAERKLKSSHRVVSRCRRGSSNRRKAVKILARQHERVGAQRRDFAHQQSRRLVDRYDLIGFENLNVKGLAAGMLAKSVHDAAWSIFTGMVAYKAANAGKLAIPVDSRGTSQECPWCGAIKKKELSEREHRCACNPGAVIDRDHASGLVILARAARVVAAYCGGLASALLATVAKSRPVETGSPGTSTRCQDTTHKSILYQDEWVVEAIDFFHDGVVYMAIFSGPGAQQRAEEYAAWKNSQVPA